jgi:hypothetical protein
MTTRTLLIVIALLLPATIAEAATPRAILMAARDLAYDANYRNDQDGLRSAIATLESLAPTAEDGYVQYYLSWSYWALSASQVQAKDTDGALQSGTKAVEHARRAVAVNSRDADFQTALANALVVVGVLGHRITDKEFMAEFMAVRRTALELGPNNPRVVLMDAGVIYNTPAEAGGSHERGLARVQEALRLFDAECDAKAVDPLAPRWGGALANGWIATMYLAQTPPQKENARSAAETALRMRPDFWYVREQLMPQLRQ